MEDGLWLLGVTLICVLLTGCGGTASSSGRITASGNCVNAAVIPSNAMADHTAAAPGDQVQFSLVVQPEPGGGVCPQFVTAGAWTTSDPVNTAISNQPATQGLATCLNATPSPATITYTGTIFGVRFKPATLTCN